MCVRARDRACARVRVCVMLRSIEHRMLHTTPVKYNEKHEDDMINTPDVTSCVYIPNGPIAATRQGPFHQDLPPDFQAFIQHRQEEDANARTQHSFNIHDTAKRYFI